MGNSRHWKVRSTSERKFLLSNLSLPGGSECFSFIGSCVSRVATPLRKVLSAEQWLVMTWSWCHRGFEPPCYHGYHEPVLWCSESLSRVPLNGAEPVLSGRAAGVKAIGIRCFLGKGTCTCTCTSPFKCCGCGQYRWCILMYVLLPCLHRPRGPVHPVHVSIHPGLCIHVHCRAKGSANEADFPEWLMKMSQNIIEVIRHYTILA